MGSVMFIGAGMMEGAGKVNAPLRICSQGCENLTIRLASGLPLPLEKSRVFPISGMTASQTHV
jgi:hypothetical protein